MPLKSTLLIASFAFSLLSYTQNKKTTNPKNTIAVSIPVICNNSEAFYIRLGSKVNTSGNAVSYGVTINYSRTLLVGICATAGVGYFNQVFDIRRPFDFESPTSLYFFTDTYKYRTLQFMLGLGYQQPINDKTSLNAQVSYNNFNSFQQKYIVDKTSKSWQTNSKSLPVGSTFNIDIGAEQKIKKRISVGAGVVVPVIVSWESDEIFFDDTRIGENKFSGGIKLSVKYHL